MKKVCIAILIMALMISFCSCKKNENIVEPTVTNPTVTTTMPTTIPTVPDIPLPSENIPDPSVDSSTLEDAIENTTK